MFSILQCILNKISIVKSVKNIFGLMIRNNTFLSHMLFKTCIKATYKYDMDVSTVHYVMRKPTNLTTRKGFS